jgi:RNA polymerase sigma-70 factor (ECF subfamily)
MTFPAKKYHFLNQVLDEVFDGLYGYAMILSRDRTEAEDLVQETCVRAVKAIERLQPGSDAKSWLFKILRNIWLNQVRQRRAAPKIVELDVDESAADLAVETSKDPHALYVSQVERDQVREAILQLPDGFREIIMLREYEELSYQQTATLLGCPAGTVMSRLGRARLKLRSLLSNTLGTSGRRAKRATPGPTARARLNSIPLRASAGASSSFGTRSGKIARQLGDSIASAADNAKVKTNNSQGLMACAIVVAARTIAIPTIHNSVPKINFLRSQMSPIEPAGRANKKNGNALAV